MRTSPTRSLVVALALVLLVGLGACGSDDEPAFEAGETVVGPADTATATTSVVDPTHPEVARSPAVGEARVGTLVVDGRARSFRVYVPSVLPPGQVPLLLALHGGGGSAEQFERASGFDEVAEANGFVVAYPEGIPSPRLAAAHTWNGGYCCGPAQQEGVDDVAFVAALVDRLGDELPIDPERVHAAGHSNGGIMAYRLACELADRIVAVAAVGASLGVDRCDPGGPVSLLHVHGTADANHPIDGGVGEDGISGVDFRSASSSVDALADAIGCPEGSVTIRQGDLLVRDRAPCDGGAVVRFVTIDGAEHAWPGSSAGGRGVGGAPYPGYDASTEIWGFFAEVGP